MVELMDLASRHAVLARDLFTLAEFDGEFDYVLEYTCYCAIDPLRRAEYADRIARLLKLGGVYIALAMPIGDWTEGPPFAVNPDELVRLLQTRGLALMRREFPQDSIPPRRGREELLLLQKT
jgi:hypothetical protein